jgi:predicted nucleic acid-binding protein
MKIFLDANIIISVLNKEYPVFTYSSRILSLADHPRFKLFTSPLCIAIAYYFSEKKSGKKEARKKIELLCKHVDLTSMDAKTVIKSLENKKITDIEDGMHYYSAMDKGCLCIVTENIQDFYFSEIEILTARRFFEVHLRK